MCVRACVRVLQGSVCVYVGVHDFTFRKCVCARACVCVCVCLIDMVKYSDVEISNY